MASKAVSGGPSVLSNEALFTLPAAVLVAPSVVAAARGDEVVMQKYYAHADGDAVIYCPQCRKVMVYVGTLTVQGAGPGQIETYVCSPCRVRCNRETSFYYDADHATEKGKFSGDSNEG